MEQEFKLNHIPSSPSDEDISFSSVKEKFVAAGPFQDRYATHIIPEHTPVSNQGRWGTCGANAIVDALEILMGLEDPSKVTQLSRLFVYWNARVPNEKTDQDSGIELRHGFNSVKKLGVCPETDWSYENNSIYLQPPISAYKVGNTNTFQEFYRVTSFGSDRLVDIEAAIRANHPVVFGTAIAKEFMKNYYADENKSWAPPGENQIFGYHAMIITGVRFNANSELEFLIRNSWGEAWGHKGHCWFKASYIDYEETSDIWVPTRAPQLLL